MSRTADKTDEQEQKLFVGGLNKKDTDEEKIKGYVMLWFNFIFCIYDHCIGLMYRYVLLDLYYNIKI